MSERMSKVNKDERASGAEREGECTDAEINHIEGWNDSVRQIVREIERVCIYF